MKRGWIVFFLFTISLLTSCRKNYECVCTTPSGQFSNTMHQVRKNQAKNSCSAQEEQFSVGNPIISCEAKLVD